MGMGSNPMEVTGCNASAGVTRAGIPGGKDKNLHSFPLQGRLPDAPQGVPLALRKCPLISAEPVAASQLLELSRLWLE